MHPTRTAVIAPLALACLFAGGQIASASPIAYTTRAAFDAATTGLSTIDFDALNAGDIIASGSSVNGVEFVYDFGGFQMEIQGHLDTTSPLNSLGTDGDGTFVAGDSFVMNFGTVQAIGMYLIAIDEIFAGDFSLSIAAGSGDNSATSIGSLPDGSQVYFLGLVDPDGFTSATLESLAGPQFLFNVDDIVTGQARQTTVAPEPSSLLLLGLAGAALVRRARYRAGRMA